MSIATSFSRVGFDLPKLSFSFRTAIAACAALMAAWLLGLEHPLWSAMTVWAASQPTRGQLIEKSLFRVAGTVVGSLVGILLMFISHGQPIVLVIGLAIWIALCAGVGNILRGFIAYGTILAGYSASMVALLDSTHPDQVLALGLDRMAAILVGVAVALIIGLVCTPGVAEEALTGRIRRLSARVLRVLIDALSPTSDDGQLASHQYDILAEMAAIEEQLGPHGAGSLRSRRSAHRLRTVLMAQTSLVLEARRLGGRERSPSCPILIGVLREAATALESGLSSEVSFDAMASLIKATADIPTLHDPLSVMDQAMREYVGTGAALWKLRQPSSHPVVMHRDWAGAWRASVRAAVTLLAVGLFWVATRWSAGAYLMLGVSIMTSLFSTFDNPARMMRFVFIGQIYGALGALACQFLIWPLASNELQIVLLTMPFILAAPLFFSHRSTASSAFDYAMVSLLLLHPAYPVQGHFVAALEGCVAVVAAPLIAMFAYRFVFPMDAKGRLAMLLAMMVHEVQDMAGSRDPMSRPLVWRARLYHRLLRLARLADMSGRERSKALEAGLTVLSLGSAIMAMRRMLDNGTMPDSVERSVRTALGSLARVGKDTTSTVTATGQAAAAALAGAADQLLHLGLPETALLASAATDLRANAAFLLQAHGATPNAK